MGIPVGVLLVVAVAFAMYSCYGWISRWFIMCGMVNYLWQETALKWWAGDCRDMGRNRLDLPKDLCIHNRSDLAGLLRGREAIIAPPVVLDYMLATK